MKKKLLIILVLAGLFAVGFESLSTNQAQLYRVRAEGNEDGASLAAAFDLTTEGDYANRDTSGTTWSLPTVNQKSPANSVVFYFAAGSAANATFNAACFGYRESNGMAQKVCEVAVVLGTQAMVKYPDTTGDATTKFWADQITVTDYWPKEVTAGSSTGDNNIAASVFFDTMGCKYFKWIIWNADGVTGVEADNVTVWGSWF